MITSFVSFAFYPPCPSSLCLFRSADCDCLVRARIYTVCEVCLRLYNSLFRSLFLLKNATATRGWNPKKGNSNDKTNIMAYIFLFRRRALSVLRTSFSSFACRRNFFLSAGVGGRLNIRASKWCQTINKQRTGFLSRASFFLLLFSFDCCCVDRCHAHFISAYKLNVLTKQFWRMLTRTFSTSHVYSRSSRSSYNNSLYKIHIYMQCAVFIASWHNGKLL